MCGKEPVDDEGIEANAFLNSLDDVSIPELSYETLKYLRDALGTSEYQRAIGSIGLSEADAIAYARRTALSVCSVLQMLRMEGSLNPVKLVLNAAAIGYERGIKDAFDMKMSAEGAKVIADKVEREEESGRAVERFRQELEEL